MSRCEITLGICHKWTFHKCGRPLGMSFLRGYETKSTLITLLELRRSEECLKSDPTPFNRGFHRFAVFTACATFILIIPGALVASNDAGLSVPDWPTSYGHVFRLPPWIGGIRYEHSHRVIAGFTIFLTASIALWTR